MTVVGIKFRDWVMIRVNARHKKVAEEGNMYIEMDPEIN